MFMFIFSHLLAGWFTFLLPSYSTFKALRQRPLHEQEIERWASYWVVVGAVVAFEHTAEWLLCWFPFYWEIKTGFLLFLSLPQFEARGSTYLYKSYVEPYLVQNESDIDASIASARNETLLFIQSRLSTLWDLLYSLLSKTPVTSKPSPSGATPANGFPDFGQISLLQSVQGFWGAINPPAYSKQTISRSASDTIASEKQAPSNAYSNDPSVTAGYDVDETIKD